MRKLSKNNSKTWFDKHRNIYDSFLLEPSKEFVVSIREFFQYINPSIVAEPKFNKSFVRINRDMRFAKKPYKDYFLIRFGKIKWDSELYLVISQDGLGIGLFINNEIEDSVFKINVLNHNELFIKYCKKYRISNKFSIYELMKMELITKRFLPERDTNKILELNDFLFRKDYSSDKKIIYSKKFIINIIKIYHQLYPIYIFATSNDLLKDLKNYDNKMGQLNIVKRR